MNKIVLATIALAFALLASAEYKTAVDTAQEVHDPACFASKTNTMLFRAFNSNGRYDPTVIKNLAKFSKNVTNIYVYMNPCFHCGEPVKQIKALLEAVKSHFIPLIFVHVEEEGWSNNVTMNSEFLKPIIDFIRSMSSRRIGILTDQKAWEKVMGKTCTQFKDVLLWYDSNDKKPDMHDFKPFGGWTKPAAKRYIREGPYCGNTVGSSITTFA